MAPRTTPVATPVESFPTATIDAGTPGNPEVATALPNTPKDPDPIDPPKRGRGRPPKAKPAPAAEDKATTGRPSNETKMAKSIAAQYRMLGKVVGNVAPLAGHAIREDADDCAAALAAWAETNPRVKRFLESGTTNLGLFGVLAAHTSIVAMVIAELKLRQMGIDTNTVDPEMAKALLNSMKPDA